ncbi:uncharacterized protein LOC131188518 [Ahaetulla prasina]|uniref:uncharacterized protein LOC131188518 n=1 Tax=Ahaetulla prasina TaxID=499056 RepID=UPI00264A04B2|nr:uncharacterized protein LOC131188518 [Ahaetulla prasina]
MVRADCSLLPAAGRPSFSTTAQRQRPRARCLLSPAERWPDSRGGGGEEQLPPPPPGRAVPKLGAWWAAFPWGCDLPQRRNGQGKTLSRRAGCASGASRCSCSLPVTASQQPMDQLNTLQSFQGTFGAPKGETFPPMDLPGYGELGAHHHHPRHSRPMWLRARLKAVTMFDQTSVMFPGGGCLALDLASPDRGPKSGLAEVPDQFGQEMPLPTGEPTAAVEAKRCPPCHLSALAQPSSLMGRKGDVGLRQAIVNSFRNEGNGTQGVFGSVDETKPWDRLASYKNSRINKHEHGINRKRKMLHATGEKPLTPQFLPPPPHPTPLPASAGPRDAPPRPPAPPLFPPPSQPQSPAAAAEAAPGLRCRSPHFLAGVPKEAPLQGVLRTWTRRKFPAAAPRPGRGSLGGWAEALQRSPDPPLLAQHLSAPERDFSQRLWTETKCEFFDPGSKWIQSCLAFPGQAQQPHPLAAEPLPMDLKKTVPASREQGWYLKLMAPNIKGPSYAWLDPSRLYCHPQALQDCVEDLVRPFRDDAIDQVVGIDAMGFVLGAAIAVTLRKGFVTIRKAGHLCVETCTQTYRDYTDREKVMEARTDAIGPGVRVLLVDQWVETGGTMRGAIQLVERQGGVVAGIAAICIEDSDGGHWLKRHYKWSHCVAPHLMPQFNAHQLDSFQAFRTSLPSQEQPQNL